jgi:hypothetical protein
MSTEEKPVYPTTALRTPALKIKGSGSYVPPSTELTSSPGSTTETEGKPIPPS